MVIDIHSHIIPKNLVGVDKFGIYIENINNHSQTFTLRSWGGVTVDNVQENLIDPQSQVEDMKEQGIDVKVLSLPPFLFAYDKDDKWALNWHMSSNNHIAEICSTYPDSFLGFGTVPLQNIDFAVREMTRCINDLGFKGIEIGTNVNGLDLDNERFSRFFQEANRLECSILIHPNNVFMGSRLSSYYLENLIGNPYETTISATRLIVSGFFEKYPKIRVCLSHGGGALPYILGRIRHGSKVRPEICLKNELELPNQMFFDMVVYDPETMIFLISKADIDNVLLGSDYPFDMGDPQSIILIKSNLEEAEQSKILRSNAKRFLKMQ